MISSKIEGFEDTIKAIQNFKKDTLNKTEEFVKRLSDLGISVAQYKSNYIDDIGAIASFIGYTKEIKTDNKGTVCTIMAKQTAKVTKSWLTLDGIKTVEVDALLMAEFGSGFNASATKQHQRIVNNTKDVGQGTFPGQTHAFNSGGWSWKTPDNIWHHSKGIKPTMPMYSAYIEMLKEINSIKKEVFNE